MITDTRSIADALRSFITSHFLPGEDPATLADDTPLMTGGILDSIRTLKLLAWIEEAFGVFVGFEYGPDVGHLDTIRGIVGAIEAARQEQVAQSRGE